MEMSSLVVALVVVVLAVVQSVFGVGLLVFGTPTLLVLGYSFGETLGYLLPASMAISLLQVVHAGGFGLDHFRRQFLVYTAPFVLIGATVILTVGSSIDIRLIVGVMLLVSGAMRMFTRLRESAGRLIRRFLPASLTVLGVIHGLSNLGGGLLTLIAGSIYEGKDEIRRQIAFSYLGMAAVQLVTLALTFRADLTPWLMVVLPALAAATFLLVGNRAFRAASQRGYQVSLTALIIVFGMGLLFGI